MVGEYACIVIRVCDQSAMYCSSRRERDWALGVARPGWLVTPQHRDAKVEIDMIRSRHYNCGYGVEHAGVGVLGTFGADRGRLMDRGTW